MEIKRIGLDLDDVLGNTLDSLLKWYNQKHETGFKREDFYTYKWWKIWGTDKDTALREWFEFTDSSYFGSIPVIQGAVKGVQAISNGRKPVGLTHRSPHLQMRTYSWLQREFSGNIKEVIHNYPFSSGRTKRKSDMCKEARVELIVEDRLKNAIECSDAGIEVILYDTPWNQNSQLPEGMVKLPEGIQRAYNWSQVVDQIYDSH